MSKIIKRQIFIPGMSRQGYRNMQEGGCSNETKCKGLACKNCIYSAHNLDHFIQYFDLKEAPDTITVNEIGGEEELH